MFVFVSKHDFGKQWHLQTLHTTNLWSFFTKYEHIIILVCSLKHMSNLVWFTNWEIKSCVGNKKYCYRISYSIWPNAQSTHARSSWEGLIISVRSQSIQLSWVDVLLLKYVSHLHLQPLVSGTNYHCSLRLLLISILLNRNFKHSSF